MIKYRSFFIKFLAIFCLTLNLSSVFAGNREYSEKDFISWQIEFSKYAVKKGIAESTIEKAFKDVKFNHDYIAADKKQFTRNWTFDEYYNNAVNNLRIKKARNRIMWYNNVLIDVAKKYGVQKEYIVALWAIESGFNEEVGKNYVVSALANLTYEGRREELFKKELLNALIMIENGYVNPEEFKGSWAGATGQCQFMPSTYLKYAVDYDKDGKRDIWHTKSDIFASIANYLRTIGWNDKLPWGYEIKFIDIEAKEYFNKKKYVKLKRLAKRGAVRKDGKKFSEYELSKKVKLINYGNRYFVAFKNFSKIKEWNRSDYFALTVGLLAQEIIKEKETNK